MKLNYIFIWILLFFLGGGTEIYAQSSVRTYKKNSVLATGSWYKVAIATPGIYKIDVPFLKSMGLSDQQLSSASLRIFGSGGQMLGEANAEPRYDDVPETALYVEDGGDGVLDGNDYVLFYAPGPHRWRYNASLKTFGHQLNLYADTAWYYITTGGSGLRTTIANNPLTGALPEYAVDYHAFYERDSINFLNTGKQWWGQEFSKVVGLSRSYRFDLPAPPVGAVAINIRAAARSGSGSNFNATVNKAAAVSNLYLLPVTDNIFEGVATAATGTGSAAVTQAQLEVGVEFVPGSINDRGWLDYLEVQARCPLVLPSSGMIDFRSTLYAGSGQWSRFALHHADAQTKVWDVTDPLHPILINTTLQGDSLLFAGRNDGLREYMAFRPADAAEPGFAGMVPNQDLHGSGPADMIIITTRALQAQAERLATLHRAADQLSVQVTPIDQVYQEFASGTPDPTAIRDYVKMFYDRGPAPRYLLLFGAASYDYRQRIKNNSNDIPSWESDASLDAIRSYVSDDYFGILKDAGDITRTDKPDLLDIGIGRIPARNVAEARLAVDKIQHYREPAAFGPWRNQATLLADDEDDNLHFDDAEKMGAILTKDVRQLNIDKIYLDAYPQESGNGGATYPEVNKAVASRINNGTLIFNYTGHGSNSRLAAENIMDAGSITDWHNDNKLPLFITATCDFAPFDDPGITSLGHKILLQHTGGAIALMTTTRAVFAASNQLMNANYLKVAFTPQADGSMPALGTAAMLAKNLTYSSSGDAVNNRKFQLLGDPALTLAFPGYRVLTDSINGRAVTAGPDTIKGLGIYTVKGHIEDLQGNLVPGYNGLLYTTVYDQPAVLKTRGNDAGSQVANFLLQRNVLFQGTQTVANGRFSLTFVAPKDIREGSGHGKISYYTTNEKQDGSGYFDNFATGGQVAAPVADVTGPTVNAWLDNRRFRNGDITGPDALLIVDLADSSGINVSGNNPIYQLTAIVDSTNYIVLNDYFGASLDSYKKGSVLFPLRGLSTGEHKITIKAWDTYNNGATTTLYFKVAEQGVLAVDEVRNYPNPFSDITRFSFVHNQQGEELRLTLEVFTIAGRLVKTMRSTIISTNGRFDGMPWDGRSDSGAKLSAGLYFYRLTISTSTGTKIKGGKLVFL
ncbi:type IX secretion system sortase PorU [Chitinophaga arvensicola]|uniref:Por secretion system C-terminal sorting domain-containing protein n=1 Tax=Chitinophaga arvensicola TaxID=29529 RepID=A0A1I0NIQ5_9BACT|nr:type IX secretion system sortase PorU [Chitinophaga arvensicola]SEW01073.1 Por secretion system C-terminal sorting domain-containing protein [Chitinophaga arvensicola]